jgi:hypothetical protein
VAAESLHYNLTWQSGLNLGEAALRADSVNGNWSFSATVDASLPGYVLRDEYRSTADAKFCSQTLERNIQRGSRKSRELSTFDHAAKKVHRQTIGGGSSDQPAAECAPDAMAFLQWLRQELAAGRMPAQHTVYLGAKYDLQLSPAGSESVRQGDRTLEADKISIHIRGPKADLTIEVLFARDPQRTPLLARLPLALGTFTVELQQ